MQSQGILGVPGHLPAPLRLSRRQCRVSAVAVTAAPPSVVQRGVTHSMPPEKQEVFRSLQGWAAESLLPLLKPVDDCWQPTDFLPDSSSDAFEHEVRELRSRAAALPDDYFVVLVGDMVTEEALPTYQTMINTLDGVRDETGASACPWAVWTRAWTAEENRHGDVLNKYMYLSGRVDMRAVEATIQHLIGSGMDPRTENNPYLGFVYTSFQERATAVSHGNTARLARARGDGVLARVCGTIAADEKRHETAYTKMSAKLFELDPDGMVRALAAVLRDKITMPGQLMTDGRDADLFAHFSAVAQRADVYTARDYGDMVEHFVRRWKVADLAGGQLSGEGRRAQDYVCGMPRKIRRMEELAHDRAIKAAKEPEFARFSWVFDRSVCIRA